MLKKILWSIVGLLVVIPLVAAIVGTKMDQFDSMQKAGAAFTMPPEKVNAYTVSEHSWQPKIKAVGSVSAVQGTIVRAETDGVIASVLFEAGRSVSKGDVLVTLESSVEKAQLYEAQVAAKWAKIAFDRAKELSKTRNISQAEMDTAETNVNQTDAKVRYYDAVIAKKTIKAPFSGELGIRKVSTGQFLEKGNEVVSLQALNIVYVEFALPQQWIGALENGLPVEVQSDAFPGKTFIGKVTALNANIDPVTRTIHVQATLENSKKELRPGMFVNASIALNLRSKSLMVPATSVHHTAFGSSLFVIVKAEDSDALVLKQQPVRLGARHGDFVIVEEGLTDGDQVVSTGVFKLRPGMSVIIDNSLAPEFKINPTPKNT